jgi:hypothetical protein
MNGDDPQRMNMQSQAMRKSMASKYPEKNPNYSPSTSYNYSPQAGFSGNAQMNTRRRPEHFRKDAPNPSERLMRQNDLIIKLLKEIRDRLPPPPVSAVKDNEPADHANAASESSESTESSKEPSPAPEDSNEGNAAEAGA